MLQTITTRTQRFGSGGVILTSKSPDGLSDQEIMARAPSVFAEDKHASRSEKFSFIPTRDLLAGLRSAGLVPMEVRQGGSRDEEKRGFTKHMIRLRRLGETAAPGGLFPEAILLNSHDGTSSYVLTGGLFRMVCTNGLIVGECIDEVRVPHRGDVMDKVIEGSFRVIEDLPRAIESSREMSAIQLTTGEQAAFAQAAAALRWDSTDPQPDPARLLHTRRHDDHGADLWRTFNRVQENMIRGGVGYTSTDQRGRRVQRSTREVRGIDQNKGLNRALWMLAEFMKEQKAA